MRCPQPPKSKILSVTWSCIEGSRRATKIMFLPGEDPLACGLWNCAMRTATCPSDGELGMVHGVRHVPEIPGNPFPLVCSYETDKYFLKSRVQTRTHGSVRGRGPKGPLLLDGETSPCGFIPGKPDCLRPSPYGVTKKIPFERMYPFPYNR
jgi:hypothetical protein